MHFPAFPEIEGYPCTDPDMFWGYACRDHVPINEFIDECLKQHCHHEHPRLPYHVHDGQPYPCHAFVHWRGFGGWTFCFPDEQGAKAITYWPADSCSYQQWMEQMLKDQCREDGCDETALRCIHVLRQFRHGGFIPQLEAAYAAATLKAATA